MTYLQFFILHILNRFRGERSVSAIFHLLRGKRTSQTIQDGFLFQVHPYFQSLPQITRKTLNKIITELEANGLILKQDNDHYILTESGRSELDNLSETYIIPSGLNGWFYGGIANTFWKRLSLIIQTMSHLQAHETHFYPITRDEHALKWIKQFLTSMKMNRDSLTLHIREELKGLWNGLPTIEADLLAHRLSGYQSNGMTIAQLSEATGKSETEIMLLIISGIHRTVQMVNENGQFPTLYHLLDEENTIGITESAHKTLHMLQSGLSLETIAGFRRLKLTTVQDHVVEIAFSQADFPISPFIDEDIYRSVVQALKKTTTRKLSVIKQNCPDHVEYFHIRLVLARES